MFLTSVRHEVNNLESSVMVLNLSLIGSVSCEKMSFVLYLLGNFCFKYIPSCNSSEEDTVT